MTLEAFEQLVGDWLDEPQRDDLRQRVETAVAVSPEFAAVRDRLIALDRGIRAALPAPIGIDHVRFALRISAGIDAVLDDAHETGAIGGALETLRSVENRVDWDRLRERVRVAVAEADVRPRIIRFPWRPIFAAGAMAAAAAVAAFVFWPRTFPPVEPPAGVAIARFVLSPPVEAGSAGAVAQVSIVPPEEPVELAAVPAAAAAEIFLMIDPPRRSAVRMGLN